eukprot:g2464.t1
MNRFNMGTSLVAIVVMSLLTTTVDAKLLSSLIAKPITSIAGAFVGAEKLGGKYALAGLLLGTPVLTGRYDGGTLLGLKDGGILRDTISSKLDGLFDPLLAIEPFKYDPVGKKSKTTKSLFGSKIGTAVTAGGDVVSSKLQQKLSALTDGLGIAKQAPFQAMDIADTLVRTKENIVRGAIDGTESIIESNPQTAAMKNLLFRALIYHVYMDAGLNARMSMLEQITKRGLGITDLTTDTLDRLRGATGTVVDALALPTGVFNLQATDDEDQSSDSVYVLFTDRIAQLQDAVRGTRNSTADGQSSFFSAVDNWLGSFQNSEGATRIDQAQRWRLDVSDYLDRQTQNIERDLNATLNERSESLIRLLEGSSVPEIDIDRARSYLTDLGRVTNTSASSALGNYLDLTGTVFDSIRDLAANGMSDPLDFQRAGDLLGTGAANTASSIWETYRSAFDRQQQIASLFNLDLPSTTDSFNSAFSSLLDLFQDFNPVFPISI